MIQEKASSVAQEADVSNETEQIRVPVSGFAVAQELVQSSVVYFDFFAKDRILVFSNLHWMWSLEINLHIWCWISTVSQGSYSGQAISRP